MNTLIYDCEILKDPTIHGWRNFEALGISVIGCHANWLPQPLISFDRRSPDYLKRFQKLADQADRIVGFNSRNFDDPLCQSFGVRIATNIDLLEEIREMSGQPRRYTKGLTRAGYNLGAICEANGLGRKTGHGAEAPIQWQRGEYDEVIRYCLHDVKLTHDLYLLWLEGKIIDPTTGVVLSRSKTEQPEMRPENPDRV